MLGGWGATVITGMSLEDAKTALKTHPSIQIALVDYHLDHSKLGIDIIEAILTVRRDIVSAIITADRSDKMRTQAKNLGAAILNKPLKPAALRSWITLELRGKPLPPLA